MPPMQGFQAIPWHPLAPVLEPIAHARRPATPPPIEPQSATLIASDGSPAFVLTQLVLDPHSSEIVGRAGYADQTTGRKIRTWLRYATPARR